MSDPGRKKFSDKISEAVKPDSQKSNWEKASEDVSNKYDEAAGRMQAEEDKGIFQKIGDSLTGNKNKK
jgi:hypothetical protein